MSTKRLAIVAATVTALAAVSAVVALAAGGGGSWSSGAGMTGGRYVYRPAQPIQVHTLAAARSDAQQQLDFKSFDAFLEALEVPLATLDARALPRRNLALVTR